MKTRIATALSVVGVLGAGSAAALVNTQILDGGPAESASAAVLPPASTVDVTIPDITVGTTAPEVSVESTSPSPDSTVPETTELPAPAPAPTGYLTAFNVGSAGVVTVDVIDGQIVLVDTEAKPGWDITEVAESADGNEVEVEFSSSTVRVEFEASLFDGQIVPKVSSTSIGGRSGATGTASPAGAAPVTTVSRDDDSHDHDSDDDEHDEVDEPDDDEPDEVDDDEHDEHDDERDDD